MEINGIPLIFVHKGNQTYFKICLEHNLKTQKTSKVIVLGDNSLSIKSFKKFKTRISLAICTDYFNSAMIFSKSYKHLSPNSFDFELFCIQRWFIILEYCTKNNIKEFFCCDSDCLTYSNLTQIANIRLENKKISIVDQICPNCTYFTLDSLQSFCNFITLNYTDTKLVSNLEEYYNFKKQNNLGGICDMTFFELYEKENPGSIHDFGVPQNNHLFDSNISTSNGFIMKNQFGIKEINFEKSIPYCKKSNTNEKYFFDVLHFQGGEKFFMAKYANTSIKQKIFFLLNNNFFKLMHYYIYMPLKLIYKKIRNT